MATIVEARGTIETVARDLVLGTFCNIRLLCTNIIREKNFEGIKKYEKLDDEVQTTFYICFTFI